METYSRGRRGAPAKGVGRGTAARVRIPLSPPVKKHVDLRSTFFIYFNDFLSIDVQIYRKINKMKEYGYIFTTFKQPLSKKC